MSRTHLPQGRDDRPGRTPGPHDQGPAAGRVPPVVGGEGVEEARPVGAVALDLGAPPRQAVHRPQPLGPGGEDVGAGGRGRLVGHGDRHAGQVEAAHRRQGVARALLAALARAGHARGARHLWLTAKQDNTAAHAFYRRLGSRGEPVIAFAVVEQDFRNLAAEAP